MEFKDIGTIPYEAPPEAFKPFFWRKYRSWFRTFQTHTAGILNRKTFLNETEQIVKQFPENQREGAKKRITAHWDFVVLWGREHITEDECINYWLNRRVFASPDKRKKALEESKMHTTMYFEHLDTNKNGVLEMEEFLKTPSLTDRETMKELFHEIDANKDGIISMEEWQFTILSFHFTSGPDDPHSYIFGPPADE